MSTGKIIGTIIAAAGVGVAIYFGFVKKGADGQSAFLRLTGKKPEDKKEETPKKDTLQLPDSDPVHHTKQTPFSAPLPTDSILQEKAQVNSVGKNLWSVYGGTKVYVNNGKYDTVYKTVAKDGFIGVIDKETLAGAFYIVGGNQYAVAKAGTIIK